MHWAFFLLAPCDPFEFVISRSAVRARLPAPFLLDSLTICDPAPSPASLKAHGLPPGPERPTSWQTFLGAHWGAIAAADFFTTEVWTWHGLVTDDSVFVIDLASRRVQILGATPHPHDLFMQQGARTLTAADEGMLRSHRALICDRDRCWSPSFRQVLRTAGIRMVQTPFQASNAHAYAERFVRSIKHECLARMIPLGDVTSSAPCTSSSSLTTVSAITRALITR